MANALTSRGGFTLVELLAVMGIIAILAGIVLGITKIATGKAATAAAMTDFELIKNELEDYRLEYGGYPDVRPDTNMVDATLFTNWVDETTEFSLIDPWGKSYIYEHNKNTAKFQYDLWSKGPDGIAGTADDLPENRGIK